MQSYRQNMPTRERQVFRDWAQGVGAGCFGAVRVRDVDVFGDAG